jgi:hypothetical protein
MILRAYSMPIAVPKGEGTDINLIHSDRREKFGLFMQL